MLKNLTNDFVCGKLVLCGCFLTLELEVDMKKHEIYNVIKIKDNVACEIYSTMVFDTAEKKFIETAESLGYEIIDDDDNIINEGYFENKAMNESVCLITSYLEND